MPVHDWTRVRANRFHDFHQRWTVAICNALNAGSLPPRERYVLCPLEATYQTAWEQVPAPLRGPLESPPTSGGNPQA
jgi:hypothetical protein